MVCKVVFKIDGVSVACVCMDGLDDYYGHDPYYGDLMIAEEIISELELTLEKLKRMEPTDSRPFLNTEDFQDYLKAYALLIATAKKYPTARLIMV